MLLFAGGGLAAVIGFGIVAFTRASIMTRNGGYRGHASSRASAPTGGRFCSGCGRRSRRRRGSATPAVQPLAELEIRRVGYGHPDALLLIEEVQAEYVARYGGRDETPLDPLMFEPPDGSFFVGYLDGTPVASGAWRRSTVEAFGTARTAEIKRMYVAPAARGQGLARRMLAHLEADAAEHGAEAIVLESGLRQPEAIELYTSSGYTPIPSFGYYKFARLSRCFGRRLPTTT